MSALYQDLDFTNFPNALDNIALKSNITNAADAQLVSQIQTAILNNDFVTAANLLKHYRDVRTGQPCGKGER